MDIDTLERDLDSKDLELNEIGRVMLMTTSPLTYDAYSRNRQTGSIIIVDEATNQTVGAGMICEPHKEIPALDE